MLLQVLAKEPYPFTLDMSYREILDVDDCLGDPCAEGATCVDESFNFTCVCPPGAIGRLCEGERDRFLDMFTNHGFAYAKGMAFHDKYLSKCCL